MIEWVVNKPGMRLGLGDSFDYTGDADLVFSHLYGPLPPQLIGKPAIINVCGDKKASAEKWCGAELHEVSKWARGGTNTIYVANMPVTALECWWEMGRGKSLIDLVEDELSPGRGWFPEELVRRLLMAWGGGILPVTVFDGFMGRGTVGKIARELKLNFVGIDRNPDRIAIAREYLQV